jgi:hypothetical protein
LAFGVALCACSTVAAQDTERPFRLGGVLPGGVRNSTTESWGTFDFNLTNMTDTDRQGRLLTFFTGQPDVQYGRDVWVPAHSTLSTWMLVGPAAAQDRQKSREVQVLLYERTGGQERLVPPPGQRRIRERGVLYRKREPFTSILLDHDAPQEAIFGQLPQPEAASEEIIRCVRTFRSARFLSEFVQVANPSPLPPTAEAFDGVDHFVLASGRIAGDSGGMRALRQWLERGGKVWVMLDRLDVDVLAPLLGDALDFQVVDRVSLTTIEMVEEPVPIDVAATLPQQHERPVDFVRVVLPPGERPRHTVNGWPAWFTRRVGRGLVVVSTLGARAWYKPRGPKGPPSPYKRYPSLPLPTDALNALAAELEPAPEADPLDAEAFRPLLTDAIGYAVISRGSVALVFGAFLLGALGLGLVVRSTRRPELRGWLGPAAALGSAAVLAGLGAAARRAAAPTVAVAQVVEAVAGKEEAALHGLLASYQPDSGPADVGAAKGGLFELDMTGLEGRTRRLILTDPEAWHWENLTLPAGVRFASFRYTAPTGTPLAATAHFGPEGVEGKLVAGPFHDLADALLCPPSGRKLALHLGADGAFRAGSQDILPAGQMLPAALLSDRQQRRQELYRTFLKRPGAGRLAGRTFLLAWAEPIAMHFTLAPDAHLAGTALLVIPLRLEHSAPGGRVTIPGPLLPYRRIMDGGHLTAGESAPPTREATIATNMHLRFQLPTEVLPLKVERARLLAKIDAPGRRVTIAGLAEGKPVEVHRVDSPLDPIRVEISEERLLHVDAGGGLHVNVTIGSSGNRREGAQGAEKWTIHYLELEVTGQTK